MSTQATVALVRKWLYTMMPPHLRVQVILRSRENRIEQDQTPAQPADVPRILCNAGALRRAARRVTHLYDTELASVGLNLCQYGLLSAINSRGATLPSVQELADEIVLDRSTLGQNLRPLERDGLISLLTDPKDQRVRLIALTKLGIAKFKEAHKHWKVAQERFEAVFGQEEAAQLRSVLLSIAYNSELGKQK